tara:strand:- start:132 stop:599 length:468 start_codon:yes stop_codon:yes gene_type:complete
MEQNYNNMKKFAYNNDTNCCTVIASAIAFNQPFEKVQKDFFDKGYRVKGKGFYFFDHVEKISKDYGFNCEVIAKNKYEVKKIFGKGLTPKTVASYLDLQTYFIGTRGHVFALKDGIVEDWTRNRKHYVNRICRVTPIKKVKDLNISKPKYDFSQY